LEPAAGHAVRESDPFQDTPTITFRNRETSPHATRLRLMWENMREAIIENFPKAPGLPHDVATYLKRANDTYLNDAYHSLSIEGYRVTPALIERVRAGKLEPRSKRRRS
jgi:hypothetical protein